MSRGSEPSGDRVGQHTSKWGKQVGGSTTSQSEFEEGQNMHMIHTTRLTALIVPWLERAAVQCNAFQQKASPAGINCYILALSST